MHGEGGERVSQRAWAIARGGRNGRARETPSWEQGLPPQHAPRTTHQAPRPRNVRFLTRLMLVTGGAALTPEGPSVSSPVPPAFSVSSSFASVSAMFL